jgi:hypothetical protein
MVLYRTDGPELQSNLCQTDFLLLDPSEGECVPSGDYGLLRGFWLYQWEDPSGNLGGVVWAFDIFNCRDTFRTSRGVCQPDCARQTDSGWYELDDSAHLITLHTMMSCDENFCNNYSESPLVSTLSYEIEGNQLILGTETLQYVEDHEVGF